MSLKCLLNGLEVNYPCSPTCALFGDCCTAFEAQRKSRVVTNADHIRSLSDEELAKFLNDFFWGRKENVRLFALKEWLKQPYKEDTHD